MEVLGRVARQVAGALLLDVESSDRPPSDSLDLEALAGTPFRRDRSMVNGSSLAFLAEFMGASLLVLP
jgi:hypothetical protein